MLITASPRPSLYQNGVFLLKLCPDCLSNYKKSKAGKTARKDGGAWGKRRWPEWVYHQQHTRKCLKHHAQGLADCAARRSRLLQATPSWADRAAILSIYQEAVRLSSGGSIAYEVDHIVPLQGELVCGLHTHHNLQVIAAVINRKKSNQFVV